MRFICLKPIKTERDHRFPQNPWICRFGRQRRVLRTTPYLWLCDWVRFTCLRSIKTERDCVFAQNLRICRFTARGECFAPFFCILACHFSSNRSILAVRLPFWMILIADSSRAKKIRGTNYPWFCDWMRFTRLKSIKTERDCTFAQNARICRFIARGDCFAPRRKRQWWDLDRQRSDLGRQRYGLERQRYELDRDRVLRASWAGWEPSVLLAARL